MQTINTANGILHPSRLPEIRPISSLLTSYYLAPLPQNLKVPEAFDEFEEEGDEEKVDMKQENMTEIEEQEEMSPIILMASPPTPSLASMFEEAPGLSALASVENLAHAHSAEAQPLPDPQTEDEELEFLPNYHELPPDYEESQQHDTIPEFVDI